MFIDETLQNHLETASSIKSQSSVIAEWNMNIAEKIKQIGNYRYRPTTRAIPRTVSSVEERDLLFASPVEGNTVYRLTAAGLLTKETYTSGSWETTDSSGNPEEIKYNYIASSFNVEDGTSDTSNFYFGATDADVVVDGGYSNSLDANTNDPVVDSVPTIFQSKKEKEATLYSLEDCLGRFRPRSGINKLRFFPKKYTHHTLADMAQRPRYYMADRKDAFKYWTSYRTENKTERGISKRDLNKLNIVNASADGEYITYVISNNHDVEAGDIVSASGVNPTDYNLQNVRVHTVTANSITVPSTITRDYIVGGLIDLTILDKYYVDDTAPFVVYDEPLPANRLVVKMQTNVGTLDLGTFQNRSGSFDDPFYGPENQTTPVRWKVQYLNEDNWIDAVSFGDGSVRRNGQPIVGPDGYVELAYGLIVPEDYRRLFYASGEYSSSDFLPEATTLSEGTSFLVRNSDLDQGTYYIVIGNEYESFYAEYGWYLEDSEINKLTSYVTDLTSPSKFYSLSEGKNKYRELEYIGGIRIVVETMNTLDSPFDLIEMSPRLMVDLSDKVKAFSVTKTASDLGLSGMPVGQLLASTGNLDLFDYDQAFFPQNPNSIISGYTTQNIAIKIYEVIMDLEGYDYHVPIKTLYLEGFPQASNFDRSVSLTLRDMFFYIESMTAPQLLIQNASLSYAVSLLLDGVGFSNYTFKRNVNEPEIIIPYFFVGPDLSVAQVLQDLAVSAQSAMFFDEYNNLVVMSKNYIMPTVDERSTDIVLSGSVDYEDSGVLENNTTSPKLANIIELSSQDNHIYNDGIINYTTRYIQKSYGSLKQAMMIDKDRTWVYKPSLLWEITGDSAAKSWNDEVTQQSTYVLSAIPLNSDLSDMLPVVNNHQIINNIIDLGDSIFWLGRYYGYFYANGEIIKYDAIQYSVPGLSTEETQNNPDGSSVWITSVQEYQKYFSKIPFNGKIYPTGLVRIFSQPDYEVVEGVTRLKNGAVAKHGRMQFGTGIRNSDGEASPSYHSAGLSAEWSSDDNLRGCYMDERFLFSQNNATASTIEGIAGLDEGKTRSKTTTREGFIKNFLTNIYAEESSLNRNLSSQTGTIQSSALVMTGSTTASEDTAPNFISYVYKPLEDRFVHFGTRLRIIGRIDNNETRGQTPFGSGPYYSGTSSTASQSTSVGGSSGGMAIMLNPETNNGYYFEVIALTENTLKDYTNGADMHNIIFYKLNRNADATVNTDKAIPTKLWGGTAAIGVDDGTLIGQARANAETNTTVYDLSVEYQIVGESLRFFLYINGNLIATVDDSNPLTIRNNMALFIRGSSRVMFENIYALTNNYSQNTTFSVGTLTDSAFGDGEINATQALQKFAISGMVQSTYLSGISSSEPPKYKIYFEEFGTIMREAAHFDIRYDKAYPALYAKIAPTFNKLKGYTISGFRAGAYGAEFLVFNATDTHLSLDSTSGNYLRILGVTFTQQSQHQLGVDEYFSKISDLSNPSFTGDGLVGSKLKVKEDYVDIKLSRLTHGRKQFSLASPYIQTQDDANDLMGWISTKIMKPRRSVGLKVFALPTLQLGDIVEIDYKNKEGTIEFNEVSKDGTRFVVYSIQYTKDTSGPSMSVFLSEVK